MIDIKRFRKNANDHYICEEKLAEWDRCVTKNDFVRLGFSVQGLDYLCNAINHGWGLPPEYIKTEFKHYINNGFISIQRGYTSKMYCCHRGDVKIISTVTAIIKSDVTVYIPENRIVEIFVVGQCNIRVLGKGRCTMLCYGLSSINIDDSMAENKVKILEKNDSERNR